MRLRSYMTPDGISLPYISLQHRPVAGIAAVEGEAEEMPSLLAATLTVHMDSDDERVRRVVPDAIRRARLAKPLAA